MTSISIEALKGKTIKQIRELIKQAESLPDNNSPQTKSSVQQEGGDSSHHNPIIADEFSEVKTGDTKTQTAQEILDEIENEE